MSVMFNYPARAANEDFKVGELLGFHPTTGVVRKIQGGDVFAGYVEEAHNLTPAGAAVFTHATKNALLKVVNGRLRMSPAAGVTPVTGSKVYAATPTTFSHDPQVGTFCGVCEGSDDNTAADWTIDTWTAYSSRGQSVDLLLTAVVGAEASDIIPVSIQLESRSGQDVAGIHDLVLQLYDSNMIESLAAAFTLSDGGAGTLVSADAQARLLFRTDATGLAEIDVEDIAKASGATVYLSVRLVNAGRFRADESVLTVTFD